MSIRPLPPEVIAQIKSSITITSLNGVICELVTNSLDAGSTKIDVRVDYSRGGCVVEDDGLGIEPSEFGENGGLGKTHHSSKLNSQTPIHGGRGTFLAALSAMALMSITSHHHLHRSHNTINMHKSEVVSRQIPAPPQQYLSHSNHGTRVTIRDLFGNMPVRVKQRAIAAEKQKGTNKDWEELRRDIVLLLVSWPRHVAITVRETEINQKLAIRLPVHSDEAGSNAEVEVSRVCSIIAQAVFISPNEKAFWVPVGISTPKLDIRGTISLQPSAVKHIQFISFGVHPVKNGEGQSTLHDEINRLFVNSSFGNEEDISDLDDAERARRAKDQRFKGDGYTNKELKGGKKGVDRWPMFYINIQQLDLQTVSRQIDPDGILDDTSNKLSTITELLQIMITQFLTLHHFRPKAGRGHRSKRRKEDSTSSLYKEFPSQATSSPKRLQIRKKPILKNAKPSFDPLGTNVELPSFRRASLKPESPFEGWSKIKSGATAPALEPKSRVAAGLEGASISRPSSAPPLRGTSSQHFTVEVPPQRPQTPLIAKNGTLLRKPFDDVTVTRPRPKVPSALVQPPETTRTVANDEDDLVQWVNPVTKVISMVNRRTGLTVPAKNEMRGGRLSTKLLSSSEPTAPAKTTSKTEKPTWISDMLQKWDNPVFSVVESTVPQVSLEGPDEHTQSILHGRHHHCSQIDIDRAFKESSAGVSGRVSKAALRNAEVISQVDRKFILVKVKTKPRYSISDHCDDGSILVLVDQHAADERIRIESLMEELCTLPKNGSALTDSPVLTILLNKPLIFEISLKEVQVLKAQLSYFAAWGILYKVASSMKSSDLVNETYHLSVRSLPPGIIERCRQDPRLLIELIRTEAWKAQEFGNTIAPSDRQQTWLQRTQCCPQGILDMLNSRACRSAIMFNDELSKVQCEKLVRKLADCMFPFQCAHGRPSLVPLVDVGTLKSSDADEELVVREQGSSDFWKSFKKWKGEQQ
ncbi:related to dna mismatch repair homologue (hpms2) [Phialocephala subalpina]|uniref:Related to dna mismatch repair homologue (Hpms2) n=1 Tax=Phialocephala subalpina TaxID=576137 RepID=A0A1L7XWB4_9HELO|nr:related to dna mismatch repair homologue (hpms2) [Phialocephala subalpina]